MRAFYLTLLSVFLFSCASLHGVRSPASIRLNEGCFSRLDSFNRPVIYLHSPYSSYRGGVGLGVYVNDVLVTGEGYLYSQEEIFKLLELDDSELSVLRREKGKVLSLGEGFGSLLEKFLNAGVEVKAMDLWYHLDQYPLENYVGQKMHDFNQKYYEHLIRGSFEFIPFPDRSLDLIVSSMLFNNIDNEELFKKGLEEMIRVLKIGGEIRLLGLLEYQVKILQGFYNIAFKSQIDLLTIERVAKDDTVSEIPVYRAILRRN